MSQPDDYDLYWADYGRLLMGYTGWGMRVVFVPDDETDLVPTIEVREPGKHEG